MMRALAALLLLVSAAADAHRPSDAYLSLASQQQSLRGQWEIALRDLDVAIGLDRNGDGAITWGELRAARPAIETLVAQNLTLTADGKICPVTLGDVLVNERSEARYAWLGLTAHCEAAVAALSLDYRFLFTLDPTHRGIVVLTAGQNTQTAVIGPSQTLQQFQLAQKSVMAQFMSYLREGVHHIWIGLDHVLFLIALLLPCVMIYTANGWSGLERLKPAFWNVLGVVTAFTIAHSITLSLAVLGIVRLNSQWVEVAIAASVLAAALNNLRPIVQRQRWLATFAFGLLHGFGFASVLTELGLPAETRFIALLGFNLGVELGQLMIVAVALPLAFSLRNTRLYRTVLLQGGSLAVAALAIWWIQQRSSLF